MKPGLIAAGPREQRHDRASIEVLPKLVAEAGPARLSAHRTVIHWEHLKYCRPSARGFAQEARREATKVVAKQESAGCRHGAVYGAADERQAAHELGEFVDSCAELARCQRDQAALRVPDQAPPLPRLPVCA